MKRISSLIFCVVVFINAALAQTGVGIGTTVPKAAFNVAENNTVLFGSDTTEAGSKLIWIPWKKAFRAGDILSSIDDTIGAYSFAVGQSNRASGQGSVAIGGENFNTGTSTISLGYGNTAQGNYSIAGGYYNTITNGNVNTVLGYQNYISGSYQTVWGIANIVSGNYNTVFGNQNKVSNDFAITGGYNNTSTGSKAITLGSDCVNNGFHSFATGYRNKMNVDYGFVSGHGNIANAIDVSVLGMYNDSIAGSHTQGWFGNDPLFIIGNGTTENYRSNAMVILKNGRTGFGTNLPAATMHIKHNSSMASPQLLVEESTTNDYARIGFTNANPGSWEIAGYPQQILSPNSAAQFNFYFSGLGLNVLSLKGNGNAVLEGTLTQSSDERLKKNIVSVKNVLPKLLMLNGYTYQWKDKARGEEEQLGLLAQELESQFPQLVLTDEKGMKSVAYANMVPVLLEAIKEQQKQIDELKRMIISKQ